MGRVVVRCDAGPSLGIGHVMRCVALGEALRDRGHEVTFLADLAAVPWARTQVEARGFAHRPAPSGVVADEVAAVEALDPWLVVVDSYLLGNDVYAALRTGRAVVLTLVDGDPHGRSGDLLLDQNIGAEGDRWPLVEGTRRLAGLGFALLRSDVLAARPPSPRVEESATPTVFAFFGGTDPLGAAPRVARALVDSGRPFAATVVAAGSPAVDELERLSLWPGQRLEVVAPVDDLARRVAKADVVLSAAGTSSWELLCLGAAAGVVCVAANQRQAYGRMVHAGIVEGLGTPDDVDTGALDRLLSDPAHRAALRRRGHGLVDGRGRERVVDACEAQVRRT